MPRHLPAGLTQYVLHAFATKSPPYHVTTDDVATPPTSVEVTKISGHQCVRGRGGAIAVLYETHWKGILRPTWERELDLQAFRPKILAYWASGPDHRQPNTQGNINSYAPPVSSPVLKANATSQGHTTSSRLMSIVPALPQLLCLQGPPFGTTPSTALGG